MSRILLVDDSPHAQRMGERILTDEGYEVVTVSNADSALIRLDDVDPDVVLADAVMPGRTGYEICQFLKMSPRHKHVRVILTAGVLETMDAARVRQVEADGTLNKPFEATALLSAVKPLAEAAAAARAGESRPGAAAAPALGTSAPKVQPPFIAVVDHEQVRAAVTVALDAAMGAMVDEISRRVVAALHTRKPESEALARHPLLPPAEPAGIQPPRPIPLEEPHAAPPPAAVPHVEPVRRVTPLRLRSGSVLGLDIGRPEMEPERPAPPVFPPPRQAAIPPASELPYVFSPAAAPESTPLPHPPDPQPPAAEAPAAPAPAPEPPVSLPASAAEPPAARLPVRAGLPRTRPGSILGLDSYEPEPEESSNQPPNDL
jgi:CheY-like chemotaxis protein